MQLLPSLVVGLIAAITGLVSYFSMNSYGVFETIGISVAIVAAGIVLYPLVMFFVGWVYGTISALIFNLFIGVSGDTMTVDEEPVRK